MCIKRVCVWMVYRYSASSGYTGVDLGRRGGCAGRGVIVAKNVLLERRSTSRCSIVWKHQKNVKTF